MCCKMMTYYKFYRVRLVTMMKKFSTTRSYPSRIKRSSILSHKIQPYIKLLTLEIQISMKTKN